MFGINFAKPKTQSGRASIKRTLFKRKDPMKIVNYLDDRLITFLDVETRDEAIDQLIDSVHRIGSIPNDQTFRKAVLHREQLVTTGIGMGVAIPHAKLGDLDDFFIAIGIQRKKGIDWNALDKAPVRLIFLIGGPDHRQSEYLQILSHLTMAIKDVERRKELLVAQTAADVVALFNPIQV